MKLRIKGNSIRFRITRSELARLAETGRLDEIVYFSLDPESHFVYALEHEPLSPAATLRYRSPEVLIVLRTKDVVTLVNSDQVGIYESVDLGSRGALELLIEKDFACLNSSDSGNVNRFPNPGFASTC